MSMLFRRENGAGEAQRLERMQVWKTELFPGTAGCLQFPEYIRAREMWHRLMWDTKKLAMVAHSYQEATPSIPLTQFFGSGSLPPSQFTT